LRRLSTVISEHRTTRYEFSHSDRLFGGHVALSVTGESTNTDGLLVRRWLIMLDLQIVEAFRSCTASIGSLILVELINLELVFVDVSG